MGVRGFESRPFLQYLRVSAAETLCRRDGLWRSLVARLVRDEEAAGSNPVSPTIYCRVAQLAEQRVVNPC